MSARPKPVKIVSLAQHQMFTRASSDPDYAKERGISVELAKAALDAHAAAGAPKLPERMKLRTAAGFGK